MAIMKTKVTKQQWDALLESLSEKLKKPRNSKIRESLRKMLDSADLKDLRDVMHLSGYKSVDYSFIHEDILRTQLEVDNLRMEDAAHSTQIKEDEERFFLVCIHAFYQIENLINYYLVKKFPDFSQLLEYVENSSNFKRHEDDKTKEVREKTVGDIDISFKMHALLHELRPNSTKENPDYMYSIIQNLRNVRNEGSHRCQIEGHRTDEKLLKFYKRNDINSVRSCLQQFVSEVKIKLEDKPKLQLKKAKSNAQKWTIKSIRPFTDEEIDAVESNIIVASENGNSVCLKMKDGSERHIPLLYSATKGINEVIDLHTAMVYLMEKPGEKEIERIYC